MKMNGKTASPAVTRLGHWRAPFLKALAETGNVTLATRSTGVGRKTAYAHRNKDAGFETAERVHGRAGDPRGAGQLRRPLEPTDEAVAGTIRDGAPGG